MSDTPASASQIGEDLEADTETGDHPPTAGQLRAAGIFVPASFANSDYVYFFAADTPKAAP